MVTISHLVKKIVKDSPFLEEALSRKIVSYGNLAEQITERLEEELDKKIKHSAVVMALRRYAEELKQFIPNRKIVFKYSFPLSFVAPKFEWLIDPKGSTTVFTAIGYLRAGGLFYKIARKEMEWKIAMHMKHVKEEGENLKRILENKPL